MQSQRKLVISGRGLMGGGLPCGRFTCWAARRHFSFAISRGSPCSSGRSRLAAFTVKGSGRPASRIATTCTGGQFSSGLSRLLLAQQHVPTDRAMGEEVLER